MNAKTLFWIFFITISVGIPALCVADQPVITIPAIFHSSQNEGIPALDISAVHQVGTSDEPTIISISPDSGDNNEDVSVSVTGTNFQEGATVSLTNSDGDTIASSDAVVASTTEITCQLLISGESAGQWDVVVTNPDDQIGTLSEGFTITSSSVPPTVTKISPATGDNSKDVAVSITGTNFQDDATVWLMNSDGDMVDSSDVEVISSTEITCQLLISDASVGQWDVVVTNPDGLTDTLSEGFTITSSTVPPTVTKISPATGDNSEDITVSITGKNFQDGATVSLTNSDEDIIESSDVEVISSTEITCQILISDATAGQWDVVVMNPDDQTGTLSKGFTITLPTPTITKLSPILGYNSANVPVTITGTNFRSGVVITLSMGDVKKTCPLSSKFTATKLQCTFPIKGISTGYWDLIIKNKDGTTVTKKNAFNVQANIGKPTITGITPDYGVNSGNVNAVIAGTNFRTGATVQLKKGAIKIVGSIKKISDTQITCTLPITTASTGKYSLIVRNNDGTSATKANVFTVMDVGPVPTITKINPNYGLSSVNTSVTITGTNFRRYVVVQMIKGTTTKKAVIKSVASNKIVSTFPTKGAATGKWKVKITNADGTTVAKINAFTIKTRATATEVVTGQASGIESATSASMPGAAISSRSSPLSYGALVPVNAPFVSTGVPAF